MPSTGLGLGLLATLAAPSARAGAPLPCMPIAGSTQADVQRLANAVRAHWAQPKTESDAMHEGAARTVESEPDAVNLSCSG